MQKIFDWIMCTLAAIHETGYGDADKSNGGDFPTNAKFQPFLGTSGLPAVVFLRNMGANEVEIAANDTSAAGIRLSPVVGATPGGSASIDKFKGSLWARSTAGASTVNWYVMPRSKN